MEGEHHVKNTTSLGNPSRQQKYRQSKLHRPLGTSTPPTSFLNWMRRGGTITWMSRNRSRKYRVVSVEHGMITTKGLPNSRRRARTRGRSPFKSGKSARLNFDFFHSFFDEKVM